MIRRAALLGAFLGLLGAFPAPALAQRTTDATLNVYRGNPGWQIRADVAAAMGRADVIRLQEVYPPKAWGAVRRLVLDRPAWHMTARLPRLEVPILWDARAWASAGRGHWLRLVPGQGQHFPARWLAWKPLRLRASGRIVTIANVHPDPAYCRPGLRGQGPVRQARAERHWRTVAAWTRRQEDQYPRRTILLGGDFNCTLDRIGRPYYPGRILAPLYRFDRSGSIDRLLISRDGRQFPKGVRRWATSAYSDHNGQYRRLEW